MHTTQTPDFLHTVVPLPSANYDKAFSSKRTSDFYLGYERDKFTGGPGVKAATEGSRKSERTWVLLPSLELPDAFHSPRRQRELVARPRSDAQCVALPQ